MGLSEREQKLLEELERGLMQTDKPFVERVRAGNSAARLVGGSLLTVVGLSLLVFSVITQLIFFGAIAFVVMLTGVVIASSNFKIGSLPDISKLTDPMTGGGSSSSAGETPRRGFFEERWDRRQGDGDAGMR